jgi:hypothetical protein
LALFVGALLTLGLSSSSFPGTVAWSGPDGLHQGIPRGANERFFPFETPTCASLQTNASINDTYNGIYTALPGDFKNWTVGPNETRPVNQSGYPNVTIGDEQQIAAWITICDSPAFGAEYAAGVNSSFSWGYGLNGSTGTYQAFYVLGWHASCSNSADRSNTGCGYSTTWYVDLVTGQIDGPWTTADGPPLGSGGPPPLEGGSSEASFLGLTAIQWLVTVGAIVTATIASVLAVSAVRRRGRTPSGSGMEPPVGTTQPGAPVAGESRTVGPADPIGPPRAGESDASDPLSDVY